MSWSGCQRPSRRGDGRRVANSPAAIDGDRPRPRINGINGINALYDIDAFDAGRRPRTAPAVPHSALAYRGCLRQIHACGAGQDMRQIGPFPRQVEVVSAKVAVSRGLSEDRAP